MHLPDDCKQYWTLVAEYQDKKDDTPKSVLVGLHGFLELTIALNHLLEYFYNIRSSFYHKKEAL